MAPRDKQRFDPEEYDWSQLARTKKSVAAAAEQSKWEDIHDLDIAQKANLVISDFTSAGALPPKAADKFIVGAVLQSVMLSMVNSDTYDTPQYIVPNTQFAGRILRPGVQGQAVPAAQRSKPVYGQTTMTFKEARGEVRIDDGVFETQVERSGLLNTIMGQINIGVGADIEDAAINGTSGGSNADPYLNLIDGWLARQTSYVVVGSGAQLDKQALKRLWKRLPRQYRSAKRKMRMFTAEDAVVDYVDTLTGRVSVEAERALREGEDDPKWNGIPIVGIPKWPDALGGTGDRTNVMLANPENLNIGFQRIVKMEQWRDPGAMQTVFTISVKFDTAISFEPATARYDDVLLTLNG